MAKEKKSKFMVYVCWGFAIAYALVGNYSTSAVFIAAAFIIIHMIENNKGK